MTKRYLYLLTAVIIVSFLTAGAVSAQSYWNNPWNNLPSNTENPFVNSSPMHEQAKKPTGYCLPNCQNYQNCCFPDPYYYRSNCASFISDVTIPDGSYIAPGSSFTKTWRLRNNGATHWNTNYKVIFSSGTQMGAPNWFALPHPVAPGQTIDISVNLTAPSTSGTFRANFKIQSDVGEIFGVGANCSVPFWAEIRTFNYNYVPSPPYNPCPNWSNCYPYPQYWCYGYNSSDCPWYNWNPSLNDNNGWWNFTPYW